MKLHCGKIIRLKNILITLLLIIVVAVGVVAVSVFYEQHPASTSTAPTSTMGLHTTQIVNGIETVDAGKYLDFQFNIPSDASTIEVGGNFSTSGSFNDFDVYIFDSANFTYYEKGQAFTALYQSGEVPSAQINAAIVSGGNYYLVLDNTFSPNSQTVNIKADVAYFTK